MKHILTVLSLLFITSLTFAQSPNYDDLKILYADANYEKLVKVAEKYTLSDKTKKEGAPYIWMSKGLYKISLSGTDNPDYKNAYKDGIKYLAKGMKNDLRYNDGAVVAEEKEFIDKLQLSLFETIENEISSGNFKKGYGWAINYQKITTNEAGIKYMMGACKHEDQDKPTARTLWQEGQKLMDAITSLDDWSEADRKMLKSGLLYSAAAMKKSRQIDQAKTLLGKAAQWFEEDADWQERYDEIVN
jgi:hypothetical protein